MAIENTVTSNFRSRSSIFKEYFLLPPIPCGVNVHLIFIPWFLDKNGITIFTTYMSLDLAHQEILRVRVGKSGRNGDLSFIKT